MEPRVFPGLSLSKADPGALSQTFHNSDVTLSPPSRLIRQQERFHNLREAVRLRRENGL